MFANSLDPDQAQQNLDPNCLMVFLKEFFKKRDFEKLTTKYLRQQGSESIKYHNCPTIPNGEVTKSQ